MDLQTAMQSNLFTFVLRFSQAIVTRKFMSNLLSIVKWHVKQQMIMKKTNNLQEVKSICETRLSVKALYNQRDKVRSFLFWLSRN